MRRAVQAFGLIALFVSLTAAQNVQVPPVTMRGATQAVPRKVGSEPTLGKGSYYPPFCQPSSCLYYAGDFESSWSGANGLFNANDAGSGDLAQVWVGVRPTEDARVTGATFVQSLSDGYVGVNPTWFTVQVGIKPGQVGTTVCSTSGNPTYSEYGNNGGYTYSYTISRLSKPCKLNKGTVYYVNLLPTSADGLGSVLNVQPKSPPNHHGWKNDPNDCYFNGVMGGDNYNYVPCDRLGTFPEFSIALTGKQ